MEGCGDIMRRLGKDMSIEVLQWLEDPADLVRVSAVSKSLHQFVIKNGLCKKLCFKMYPELANFVDVLETSSNSDTTELKFHDLEITKMEDRDHRLYAYLARSITSLGMEGSLISAAISASSTDHYPEEGIENTLDPRARIGRRASYWCSQGTSDPEVPETLIYKLISNLCVISEIHLQLFEVYFQYGSPIYPAKAVRFGVGYLKSPLEVERITDSAQGFADDMFVWTYISPEFPMAQEANLQKFQLPKPALCIGGILKVELLGRVQKQAFDELYYIGISHVRALGWPLRPAFDVQIFDQSGRCCLKYCSETDHFLSN